MKKIMERLRNTKGFSLVELIVVIAIMAVLVGFLAPNLIGNIEKSKESTDIQTLDSISAAIQTAYADEAGNSEAIKTYQLKATKLTDVLGEDDAFAVLVKEYIGGKKYAAKCAAADGKDVYFTINSSGTIYVFYAKGDTVDFTGVTDATVETKVKDNCVYAGKSKKDLYVTR